MNLQQVISKSFFAFLLLSGCKQKYDPPAVASSASILVVDGYLNNSVDTTTIRLSRTQTLLDGADRKGELQAQMSIEDIDGNTVYNFQETSDGNYIIPGLTLNATIKYRLRIITANGKQYLSDAMPVKTTPPIDSINWLKDDRGVMVYANTHDASGDTKYYRWEYTETWTYFSNYNSVIMYANGSLGGRYPDVFQCWTTLSSKELLLGTSAKLSQDVIALAPLRLIPGGSVILSAKYSILVRQFALAKESFDYYQNLKKISEDIGSIFDPQPSQITGNLHCISNTNEVVLGFMTISTLQQQRIYITRQQVDPWGFSFVCAPKIKVPTDSFYYFFGNLGYEPTTEYFGGAFGAEPSCVNCTTRGGVVTKPDFWP